MEFTLTGIVSGNIKTVLNSEDNKRGAGEDGAVVRGRRVLTRAPLPPDTDMFQAAASGDRDWLRHSLKRALPATQPDKQGLTVLHVACLHGRLGCIELLVEARAADVNASCPRGRRPVHMVLSAQSRPHSQACLAFLLERGARPNVATDAGLTPLHLSAGEGLAACTEALVLAGADTGARDARGHTPLDLARIWCHRGVARYLKDCMWQEDKRREMGRRRAMQTLHQDLVDMHRWAEAVEKVDRQKLTEEKVTEWADRKGFPLLWAVPRATWNQAHARCLSPDRGSRRLGKGAGRKPPPPREAWNISPNPSKPPPASVDRPQGVRMSSQPERPPPEPDLRKSVTLDRAGDGRPRYKAKWDGSPRPAPKLPLDVLRRGLFPAAYPARIASPRGFKPRHVLDLERRGCSPEHSASPWTEVAMHLAEQLEPGHY